MPPWNPGRAAERPRMTGSPPPAFILLHALRDEAEEVRACADAVTALLTDLGDLGAVEEASLAGRSEKARAVRIRVEKSSRHIAEICEALENVPPHPDPASLAEIRGSLECISNDRLEPALAALHALLARFPKEPE